MTPIRAAFICSKACDIIAEDAFSVVSQHSSALFLWSAGSAWQELKGRYSWISELRGLFLCEHCKKTPHHPKWPCVLNLSRASCMFGHVDIKWVTVMCAGCSSSEKSSLAWQSSCADTSPKWEVSTPCPKTKRTREVAILKKRKGAFLNPFQSIWIWIVTARAIGCVGTWRNRVTMQATSGSFVEVLWQMTPIRAAFSCSKACDIIAEDAFSVVSQHSSALFLWSAGSAWQELKGRYSWISELRGFFLCEHCKKTPHHPKWPCVLNLSRASCMFGYVDIKWVTVMCAGYSSSEKSSLAWQSSCADTSPKWEVSTPCPKTKRTREVAILKREKGHF